MKGGIIVTKKKASMSQVLADIKPYITKKFMAAPCVKEQDIQVICQILLPRYKYYGHEPTYGYGFCGNGGCSGK